MKQVFCLLIAAILMGACASEGQVGKGAPGGPAQGPGDETGGLFGNQPGTSGDGIPIEDDAAAGERQPPARGPASSGGGEDAIRPVEIARDSGNLGSCVIGEACEKKILAKGGSGEYVWTLVEGGLPEGLELADTENKRVKIKKIDGQEIDEVGEFSLTLKVEDAADPARSAEKAFTLKISEHVAMDLYTMAEDDGGQQVWTRVQEKGEKGEDISITVPPHGILLVEAIGHAESYRWSINGQEVVCNNQGCEGTTDGLRLYRDMNLEPPEPRPEHYDYMILQAEENFVGQEANHVVIAVADDFDNEASRTISSITFQQDPCALPIVISGARTATKGRGESYSFTFTVSGGKAPYSWFHTNRDGNDPSEISAVSGTQLTFEGTIPADMAPGARIERNIVVTDSCPSTSEHPPAKVTVVVDVQCRLGAVNHVEFNARYANGNSDCDVCDETTAKFTLRLKDGTEIGNTGKIHIDTNNNDIIDDLSPSYDMRLDGEYCVEDIGQFTWWIDGDACWEYPEVFVDAVLVEAGGSFAGWNGMIGEDDLEDAESWTRDFNMTCDETGELWCAVNHYPDYRSWHQ